MLTHVDSLLAKLKQELKDLSTAEEALGREAAKTAAAAETAAAADDGASSAPPSDSTEPKGASSEKEEVVEERIKTKGEGVAH